LLDLLDNGRLGFTQAVEISYISEVEQKLLLKLLLAENSLKISLHQAKSIRCLSEDGDFNMETLSETISKSSQSVKALKLNLNEISGHLPPGISSTKDIMKYIQEALEYYSRKE
jgi:ParB family chromosome partitioning protein